MRKKFGNLAAAILAASIMTPTFLKAQTADFEEIPVQCMYEPMKVPELDAPPCATTSNSRCSAGLDDGSSIIVDNFSDFSNLHVAGLVLAADRSTQTDNPYANKIKGLIKTGDRVVVTPSYIAWFDHTTEDGVVFNPAVFKFSYERSGALAGFWSLDNKTGNFKFNSHSPRNELTPGSASPSAEKHWWDRYSPPVEQTMVVLPQNSSNRELFFFSSPYAKFNPNSGWCLVLDGYKSQQGMHYMTFARMTSWNKSVDISDNRDFAVGDASFDIGNYVNSTVEYIARQNDIVVSWKFSPVKADVSVSNLYMYFWTSYSQDLDGTLCDVSPGNNLYPGLENILMRHKFTLSSEMLQPQPKYADESSISIDGPVYAAGQVVPLNIGKPCDLKPDRSYTNQDVNTFPPYALRQGSWIMMLNENNLNPSNASMKMIQLGLPASGNSTYEDPLIVPLEKMLGWSEHHDGTIGFGAGTGPNRLIKLQKGDWYQMLFSIGSN